MFTINVYNPILKHVQVCMCVHYNCTRAKNILLNLIYVVKISDQNSDKYKSRCQCTHFKRLIDLFILCCSTSPVFRLVVLISPDMHPAGNKMTTRVFFLITFSRLKLKTYKYTHINTNTRVIQWILWIIILFFSAFLS